jgi:hypothetical protein
MVGCRWQLELAADYGPVRKRLSRFPFLLAKHYLSEPVFL